jgi:hypothetical protein
MSGSQSAFKDRHNGIQAIDRDVSFEVSESVRVGLERPCLCMTNTGGEHSVATYVSPYVQKQVIFPKEVKKKHHVREFVETNVDIPGRPRHSLSYGKPLSFNPSENNFVLNAAL